MSDDGMLHLSNAPNQSALWSPANVLKAVYGFVLFTLLIVIAHGQSQTANERNHWHCRDGLGYRDMGEINSTMTVKISASQKNRENMTQPVNPPEKVRERRAL